MNCEGRVVWIDWRKKSLCIPCFFFLLILRFFSVELNNRLSSRRKCLVSDTRSERRGGSTCLLKPASSSMAVRRSTSPAWAPCSIWTSKTCASLTLRSCFLGNLPLQRVKVPVEEENSIHPWAMRQSINTRFTHWPPTSAPRTFTNTERCRYHQKDYVFVLWTIYMPI